MIIKADFTGLRCKRKYFFKSNSVCSGFRIFSLSPHTPPWFINLQSIIRFKLKFQVWYAVNTFPTWRYFRTLPLHYTYSDKNWVPLILRLTNPCNQFFRNNLKISNLGQPQKRVNNLQYYNEETLTNSALLRINY